MTERDSIIAYIEEKARRIRDKADSGEQGWALARHDATILNTIASDIRAGLDVPSEVAA